MTAAATAAAFRSLPETPRRTRLGMPHLDAGGLSENWLLRYAGDLHWEAICKRLHAASDQIRSEWGDRLYPTFVAVRARYDEPLSRVRENEVLEASAEVEPCGRACAHGRISAVVGERRLDLEMLTTFAVREGSGLLKMALPAARLTTGWASVGAPPLIDRLAKAARRNEPLADNFSGPSLDTGRPPLGQVSYEPSPYSDYNGAGLLYFASYVTISDTAERQLVRSLGLAPLSPDWALSTSAVRRDVFYYCNLALGDSITAELVAFDREPHAVTTRVRLRRGSSGERMADVVTRRLILDQPR